MCMNRILLVLFTSLLTYNLTAQIGVQVVTQSGMADSECGDLFGGAPDPLFGVSVEGSAFNYYPAELICYNTLPDTVFQANYTCPSDVPLTVEVCLEVMDNDPILPPPLTCDIIGDCVETICDDFIIPPFGTTIDYTLSIAVPGSSSGEVNFSIETGGFAFPDNDFICNAVDLGILPYGDTLGDKTLGMYSNLCATNLNESGSPLEDDFTNQAGVWFKFNTGPAPGGLFVVEAMSDPQNVGEPIDIELAVFTMDNGACDGNLVALTGFNTIGADFNYELRKTCPSPNTDYYIFVDGGDNMGDHQGIFGLQVWDVGVTEGGDLRCDALDLGTVPEGGSVSTPEPIANFCADDVQDPFLPTFVSQHSVWFSFVAPPSGHVIIEGISDTEKAPIGIQLALYRSFNDQCTGFYSYVTSQFTTGDLDEVMEVTCLYPNRPYFILVDGSGSNPRGVFEITVTDAGDITPVTDQTLTLCDGESITVGASTYTTSGIYADTIQLFQGCDSIVNTNLTVLEELVLTIDQTQPAIGEGNANGIATATASGGMGNYSFTWCTGETGATATTLIGGEQCCVTVTDEQGCMDEVCFDVDFTTAIIPTFANDTLACNGDTDGVLTFSAINGLPPYSYEWQNTVGSLSGNGQIMTEGGSASIPSLPAGSYDITINDNFYDTMFTVLVVEPLELRIDLDEITDASCFGVCDGSINTIVSGGTPPYTYSWNNGATGDAMSIGLCSGSYQLEVTDDNGCIANLDVNVDEPEAFIATASVVQEVSCFDGDDGSLQVLDNDNSVAWEWDNGAGSTQFVDALSAGTYSVTVTNGDGCMDTTTVELPEPVAPLEVMIVESSPISCFGAADGVLTTNVSGPFASLNYSWNNGTTTAVNSNLDIGAVEVLVTNEKGCEATASYLLEQPTEVMATTFVTDINCLDGPGAGVITVENVQGGTPGYVYSIDGQNFSDLPLFENLFADAYDIVVRDAAACELIIPSTVLPPPPISVDLFSPQVNEENDNTVKLGDPVQLTAITGSNNAVFSWSHADSLQQQDVTVLPMETQIYQVVVLDTLTFCTAEDFLKIIVDTKPRVFIPNVFSPNDDGSNDTFLPFGGNDVVNIKTFRIFARGGQLIYDQKDILPGDLTRGWDGTFDRERLTPDVFVYFAEIEFFDGRVEVIKGDVTLVR